MIGKKFGHGTSSKGRRDRFLLIGIVLVFIFLISGLIVQTQSSAFQTTPQQDSPLQPAITGNLVQEYTNFTGWTSTATISGSQGIWLTSTDKSTPALIYNGTYCYGATIEGTYENLGGQDGVIWKGYWTWPEKTAVWLAGYFANPEPTREYKSVKFSNYLRVTSGWNQGGHVSVTQYQEHPNWYDHGDWNRGWTNDISTVPRNGAYAFYNKTFYNNTVINVKASDLGDTWANPILVIPWRYQQDLYDDTCWYWDFASVILTWTEFSSMGTSAKNVTLGDADHTFKTLQKFNWSASMPSGAALTFQYKVNTTTGWSNWLNVTSNQAINILASQVQMRFVLKSDTALHQKTPWITNLKIFYGDPIILPPVISNVTQKPLADSVGYLESVNVSCDIFTYAPLITAQVQYSYDDWATTYTVEMSDSSTIGTSHRWAAIPEAEVATTVKYKIYAENQFEYGTGSTYSAEYPYTVIDNVPPNIIHDNTSEWVDPLHPSVSPALVRIECQVVDTKSSLEVVKLYVTQPGVYTNNSYDMEYDTPSGRFYYELVIELPNGILYYYINATDTCHNHNITRIFSISMDVYPPTVISWESPKNPGYGVQVYIYANVSDPNGVSAVEMQWTANNWKNNISLLMDYTLIDDMWRSRDPILPKPWNTTIQWEIRATDNVGNVGVKYFSYLTTDTTDPSITKLDFILPAMEHYPFIVNITVNEPALASGINPEKSYLIYTLKSEGFLYYYVALVHVSGDRWSGTIPAAVNTFNETVYWWIVLEDNAQNNYESEVHGYIVVEEAGLVNWINYGIWIFIIIGVTGALIVYRKQVTRRGRGLTGNKFIGIGLCMTIGVTALTWVFPLLSWWDLQNLPFQEWLLRLGQSSFSNLLLVVFFVMFFVIAASFGAFYTVDKRESERSPHLAGVPEVQPIMQTLERDLRELERE